MILGQRHVQKLANQSNLCAWKTDVKWNNLKPSISLHTKYLTLTMSYKTLVPSLKIPDFQYSNITMQKVSKTCKKNGRSKHACLLNDQATNFWFSDISQSMMSSCFPLNSRNSSRKLISFKPQPAETIKKQLFDNHLNFSAERESNQLFSNLILCKASNLKLK